MALKKTLSYNAALSRLEFAERKLDTVQHKVEVLERELHRAATVADGLASILRTRRHRLASALGRLFGFRPELPPGIFEGLERANANQSRQSSDPSKNARRLSSDTPQ